jgi:transcriptional regulator with XRE-family HTH domain
MKSDAERGEFGVWLRDRRVAAGYSNASAAVAAMKRKEGYSISLSEWAEFESGTRRPSAERRVALEAFLGSTAPSGVEPQAVDNAAVLEALRDQTDLLRNVWQQLGELVTELRLDRGEVRGGFVTLSQILGELTAEPSKKPTSSESADRGGRPRRPSRS